METFILAGSAEVEERLTHVGIYRAGSIRVYRYVVFSEIVSFESPPSVLRQGG